MILIREFIIRSGFWYHGKEYLFFLIRSSWYGEKNETKDHEAAGGGSLFCDASGDDGLRFLLNQSQEKQARLKAAYTAESTVNMVESQLNKYLVESDLMKNVVESGHDITDEQFNQLAALMQNENEVIEAYEMAKDGIINQIYPLEGNEAAMGLDMLENPERRMEARLARDSKEYTIAGPFELKQGGTGMLLFNPIYFMKEGKETFWGFSLLVINWENFIDEIELDKLEDVGYHYRIWKRTMSTGERFSIAQCQDGGLENTMEVACEVPNETWYFEIVPRAAGCQRQQAAGGYFAGDSC